MDIPTTIVLIAVLVLVVAYIAQPYIAGSDQARGVRRRTSAERLRERAELLEERNQLYSAMRDLDFDYTTNKVSDEDYVTQRKALVAQGVEILQRLDILTLDEAPESDLIEAAVDSVRTGRPVSALAGPARGSAAAAAAAQASGRKPARGLKGSTRACPNCGSPIAKADKFCTACGQKLKRQH